MPPSRRHAVLHHIAAFFIRRYTAAVAAAFTLDLRLIAAVINIFVTSPLPQLMAEMSWRG